MDEVTKTILDYHSEDIKENKESIKEIIENMKELTLIVNNLATTSKNVVEGIKSLNDRITNIELKPLKFWEGVKIALATFIVTGTIGAMVVFLIFNTAKNMK